MSYNDIISKHGINIAKQCGYFEPKSEFNPLNHQESDKLIEFINPTGKSKINNLTTFFYYTGAFSIFHAGHLDVIKEIHNYMQSIGIANNSYIVISPANRDYIKTKYPTKHITDKFRYEQIRHQISLLPKPIQEKIIIDLNPMLNFTCDHNFTDLAKYFVKSLLLFSQSKHYIVSGKDKDFSILEQYQNEFKTLYVSDHTGLSSKDIMSNYDLKYIKKRCLLRCQNNRQYELFIKYFGMYYNDVEMSLLTNELTEIDLLEHALSTDKNIITICSDYQSRLKYFKFSRVFKTPLSDPEFHYPKFLDEFNPSSTLIVDSDVYSGATKQYLTSLGYQFFSILNDAIYAEKSQIITPATDEIVDFLDLMKISYPLYDIVERMSLPVMNHEQYLDFTQKLTNLKKEYTND